MSVQPGQYASLQCMPQYLNNFSLRLYALKDRVGGDYTQTYYRALLIYADSRDCGRLSPSILAAIFKDGWHIWVYDVRRTTIPQCFLFFFPCFSRRFWALMSFFNLASTTLYGPLTPRGRCIVLPARALLDTTYVTFFCLVMPAFA